MTHIFRLYWLSAAFAVHSLTLSPSFKINTKSFCSLTFDLWRKSPWWCYSSNETAFELYFRMVRFSQCYSKGDFKLIFIMIFFFNFWCFWQFIVQRNYWLKVIEKKMNELAISSVFLVSIICYVSWLIKVSILHGIKEILPLWCKCYYSMYFTHGATLQG